MAAIFTTPPGRVAGAPLGALVRIRALHADGRLFGRQAPLPATSREPAPAARAA